MIINRERLTSAAGETRDRVNDTNARRSSLVRLKTDCMLHIVLLKSMLHNTSKTLWPQFEARFAAKEALITKFDQLAELRNSIRHSRAVSEIVRKEGEAAILW